MTVRAVDIEGLTPPAPGRRPWRARFVLVAIWTTGAALLWPLLAFILSVDRGLDLTDEGLHLLEADPPSPTAVWGFPYGWHTGLMFRAVAYDVADFRTLGAVLLVLVSAVLGVQALRVGRHLRWRSDERGRGADQNVLSFREMTAAAMTGSLGGLLYYAGLFRTPHYNWLVVFGLGIAAAGALTLLLESQGRQPVRSAAVLIAGFGLFVALPAKPTTPILFAVLALPVLARVLGLRTAVRYLTGIAMVAALLLLAAVATGLWPLGFLEVFLRASRVTSLVPSHGISKAGMDVLRLPAEFIRTSPSVLALTAIAGAQRFLPRVTPRTKRLLLRLTWAGTAVAALAAPTLVRRVYAGDAGVLNALIRGRDILPLDHYYRKAALLFGLLVLAALILTVLVTRRLRPTQRRWLLLALCMPIPIHLARILNSSLFSSDYPERLYDAQLAAAAVGLVLIVGIVRSSSQVEQESKPTTRLAWPADTTVLAAFLAALPVVAAFGTAAGLHEHILFSTVFFAAAALLLVGSSGTRSERAPGMTGLLVGMVALTTVGILDSQSKPYWYPSEPISAQTVPTPVGHRGAVLKLDATRSAWMTDLTVTAGRSGWEPGTRLYGVTGSWGASTIPWHLGARVPESIMPTLLSEDLLRFNLANEDLDGWDQAWVLIEVPSPSASRNDSEASLRWAGIFATAVGRTFPDDYEPVWSSPTDSGEFANVQLWRPIGAASP